MFHPSILRENNETACNFAKTQTGLDANRFEVFHKSSRETRRSLTPVSCTPILAEHRVCSFLFHNRPFFVQPWRAFPTCSPGWIIERTEAFDTFSRYATLCSVSYQLSFSRSLHFGTISGSWDHQGQCIPTHALSARISHCPKHICLAQPRPQGQRRESWSTWRTSVSCMQPSFKVGAVLFA